MNLRFEDVSNLLGYPLMTLAWFCRFIPVGLIFGENDSMWRKNRQCVGRQGLLFQVSCSLEVQHRWPLKSYEFMHVTPRHPPAVAQLAWILEYHV
jgi:hypothetical protein